MSRLLNQNETVCLARHLIVQHRQTVFCETADLAEACTECVYLTECKGKLWNKLYVTVAKEASIKVSFALGHYPLIPKEKEDIQNHCWNSNCKYRNEGSCN